MSNVVNLAERRPRLTGRARCLACRHEWQAVCPVGVVFGLECSACGAEKGIILNPVEHDGAHYRCGCGNFYMLVTPDRIYCPGCGEDCTP